LSQKDQRPKLLYPQHLPILDKKAEIVAAINDNQVLIITGETGSGKTTQLPKFCLEAGRGLKRKIGVTEPRRIAATSIAKILNQQIVSAKPAVSYQVRFSSTDHPYSCIKLMTDGILLKEIESDPYLNKYDTIVVDEVHERSLNIDFILGYLKNILPQRPDLKVIISSATIQADRFSKFFNRAPVIEVTGRMFPVAVLYDPITDDELNKFDDPVVDKTVRTVRDLLQEKTPGGILVFLPTEAYIRDTVQKLKSDREIEVFPLFARLSFNDQQKIFEKYDKPKVIIATNIAETSITVPDIRYVIDSGLARVSHYCPKVKIRTLPVEMIAKSNADQRKGRSGRVSDGICIRLYDEADYQMMAKEHLPEILRSDLSQVILRMLIMPLGRVESFPFFDAPSKQAIKDGFKTLSIIGAVDRDNKITPLGRKLAKLPIDPRVARILIEAAKTNILEEMLIIVTALSIQDPMERPFEKEKEADERHKKFKDSRSDFLTYLNIWKAYHKTASKQNSRGKIRRFLRENFLSWPRMHEWIDLHKELSRLLKEGGFISKKNSSQKPFRDKSLGKKQTSNKQLGQEEPKDRVPYDLVHKAILSGFLGMIAKKDERKKWLYHGPRGLQVSIFPGSVLFHEGPEWIVSAGVVETTKLYARVVAKVRPEWIEQVAGDLCNRRFEDISWHYSLGRVTAVEDASLWGLSLVKGRKVHYGRINRKEARKVFIKEGLIPGHIDFSFGFLKSNLEVIESVKRWEDKLRDRSLLIHQDELFDFYDQRLSDVVNVSELRKWLKNHPKDKRLYMRIEEITHQDIDQLSKSLYPDEFLLGSHSMSLEYVFDLDSSLDGVTLKIPIELLNQVPTFVGDWLIPGWLSTKVHTLIKNLPKSIRKEIGMIQTIVESFIQQTETRSGSIIDELSAFIKKKEGVDISFYDWHLEALDLFLKMRFEILDRRNISIAVGRDFKALQDQFAVKFKQWQVPDRDKWFRSNVLSWDWDELPLQVEISPYKGGIRHLAFPGLLVTEGKINKTLFNNKQEAERETIRGINLLLEISLAENLYTLNQSLKIIPPETIRVFKKQNWTQDLIGDAIVGITQSLVYLNQMVRTKQEFDKMKGQVSESLKTCVDGFVTLLDQVAHEFKNIEMLIKTQSGERSGGWISEALDEINEHLNRLLYPGFIKSVAYQYLQDYPRYLKGINIRIERLLSRPDSDRKKSIELRPIQQEILELAGKINGNKEFQRDRLSKNKLLDDKLSNEVDELFSWMEELRISVFAQELKTKFPVSIKRLKEKINDLTFNYLFN